MNAPVGFALAVMVLFGALGWRDGLVKRVLEVAGAVAALLLTARFAGAVQPWVSERTGAGTGPALLITWAVMFIVGLVLTYYRRHPSRARVRLLDLLGEVLVPDSSGTGGANRIPGPPVRASSAAALGSKTNDDEQGLWLRSQQGVAPLKRKK